MGAFLQGNELLLILAVLLLILGPTKLPQLARGLGQAMREFKKASQGLYDEETVSQAKTLQASTVKPSTPSSDVDMNLVRQLAAKLEVSIEGKSDAELVKEVLAKAKEKGLI
ncbi:MAG: twin-arginine translocase TatA/TatE family subunit [Desulfurococcales archaeon]|nr:twin-arginine translocase TatA/TatE family subunit [Desulfurococcales archaeon]